MGVISQEHSKVNAADSCTRMIATAAAAMAFRHYS